MMKIRGDSSHLHSWLEMLTALNFSSSCEKDLREWLGTVSMEEFGGKNRTRSHNSTANPLLEQHIRTTDRAKGRIWVERIITIV
jgi:hypothetical protein